MTTATVQSDIAAASPREDHSRWAIMGGVLIVGILLVMFWSFFDRQLRFAIQQQADWGHTLVIPLIAGYLVYLQRHKLTSQQFRVAWTGLAIIIIGVAWYMLCALGPVTLRHHNLMGAGVSITIFGVVLLFFGWRAMWYLWFPVAYLCIFGQTISDRFLNIVTFTLQDITALGAFVILNMFMDVLREGNTITVVTDAGDKIPLNIAEACSGMRMLMAFLALGVAMAFAGLKYLWQQIALVILAFPTAVFVNILRVLTLAGLSMVDTEFAAGDFHTFVGLVWLVPAFLIYLGLQWVLRRMVIEPDVEAAPEPDAAAPVRFGRRAPVAFIALCVAMVVCFGGFKVAVAQLNIHLKKEAVPLREQFNTIPAALGDWQRSGEDRKVDEAIVEELGTDKYLNRAYVTGIGRDRVELDLHLAYYTGMIDAVPHVADRCMIASGFVITRQPTNHPLPVDTSSWTTSDLINRKVGEPYQQAQVAHPLDPTRMRTVHMPIGDLQIRVTEFDHPDFPNVNVFAGYMFVANGRTTPTPTDVRYLAFDRTDRYAYYAKTQIVWMGDHNTTAEDFVTIVGDFMSAFLPDFMRCLPDWPEVEARETEESTESTKPEPVT